MAARWTGHGGDFLGAMLLGAALFCMAPARVSAETSPFVREPGGLMWGATVEEAMRSFPDLRFEGYRIVGEKETPYRAYVRARAPGRIFGVRFDSVEYWFLGDRFLELRAALRSRIGPRTLVTETERSFDVLEGRIRKSYGVPAGHTVKYVTQQLSVVKETAWAGRNVSVRLRYKGPEKGDVDRLTLEMGRKGGAP